MAPATTCIASGASASSDVFVVGNRGIVLHYNGNAWSQMTSGTTNNLYEVWGTSSGDVFAVGDGGTVRHYDGSSWSSIASGVTLSLDGVWGSSPTDILVAGYGGTIVNLKYDGTSWSAPSMASGTTRNLYALWGTAANKVFAAGSEGTILYYDGTSWGALISGSTRNLLDLWGTSPSDVFAAGDDGVILHYDGTSWAPMNSGSAKNLSGLWGNASSNIFAVGDEGTVLRYDGTSWASTNNRTSGETAHWALQFEARKSDESIALRITDAPLSIYAGTVFAATLEVQNLRQDAVSGVRIRSGNEVLYYVGALDANATATIDLRLDEDKYSTGLNSLNLVAEHEHGSTPLVPLEFEVLPADSAVKVYLASVNSPLYVAETLDLSLAVAASENVEISDLEIKTLTPGITPTGYYLGSAAAQAQPVAQQIDIQSLLYPTQTSQPAQEASRVIVGRELNFEVNGLTAGNHSLTFQVAYRLGGTLIQEDFSVGVAVYQPSSVKRILAEPIVATRGEKAMVMLHVANSLPIAIEGVSVVPVGDFPVLPSEFFIGEMSAQDFLPAHFEIPTAGLQDGKEFAFKIVYRVGRETYETPELKAVLDLENPPLKLRPLYIIIPVVIVVGLGLFFWRLKRRGGLSTGTKGAKSI